MKGLIKKAYQTLELRKDNLGYSSFYRDVYFFKFRGRMYVIKEDTWSPDEGSCYEEWKLWMQKRSDPRFRKWLTPILAAGMVDNFEQPPEEGVCNWVIMPWRQSIGSVLCQNLDARTDYLQDKIFPRFQKDFPKARWYCGNRISHPEISTDLHCENWGMTNRGQWQIIDYGGD